MKSCEISEQSVQTEQILNTIDQLDFKYKKLWNK